MSVALCCFSLLAAGSAHAVLLNLDPDVTPDAKSRNTVNYYFTNGTDNSAGFTMEVRGYVTQLVDDTGVHNASGGNVTGAPCAFGFGCYTLDATFNSLGEFQSGTINLTGGFPTSSPNVNSGTIVIGDLTDFGWGGDNASGLFEYAFDITGGDFGAPAIWDADTGGTVIDTRELAFGANFINSCDGSVGDMCYNLGDWDTSGLMTREFSTGKCTNPNPLLCTALSGLTTSDTFVPVPAAIWLFGPALGLLAVMRRRVGKT